jgi:hypothetical protein
MSVHSDYLLDLRYAFFLYITSHTTFLLCYLLCVRLGSYEYVCCTSFRYFVMIMNLSCRPVCVLFHLWVHDPTVDIECDIQ